ncbi:hypothetical protein EJD97_002629 [Solanum chilense]|uniref:Uncharacterized protein n=1 Tax=Solanum chilense TaxID=4083 RepID=A0A6N2BZK7_SOLCI|nr:hypothetical protein EJD97_002629 [Solanum chilense]
MVSNDGFHHLPCSSRWSSGHYRFFKKSSTSVVCCCCEWFREIHVQLLSLSLHTPWRNGQILIDHKHFLSSPSALPGGVESFCSTAVIFSPSPSILSRETKE